MGFFDKIFGAKVEIDETRSDENKQKMRQLFNHAVSDGDSYKLIYAYNEDVKRYNYVLASKTTHTFASLIVGWRETDTSIAIVPTDPELSGCGEPELFRRAKIHKAYQMKFGGDSFIIYPDSSGYESFQAYDFLEDGDLFAYVSQEKELEAFTKFFKERYATE